MVEDQELQKPEVLNEVKEKAQKKKRTATKKKAVKKATSKKTLTPVQQKASEAVQVKEKELEYSKEYEGDAITADKLLAAFLILSVILNGFLLYKLYGNEGVISPVISDQPSSSNTGSQNTGTPSYSGNKARLEFYVMSKCPFGTQVMNGIAEPLKKLGNSVDFTVDYIGSEKADGTFNVLHGVPELEENQRQLCTIKYYPQNYKYMDYVVCRNKNLEADPSICLKEVGMDAQKILACATGEEGRQLHSDSIKKAQARQASGSPTMYLNGVKYSGGRNSIDFMRAICDSLSPRPAECADLPEPVNVELTVLNDKRCTECDTANIVGQIKQIIPGSKPKYVDYSTTEGKKLFADAGLQYLPAYFLGKVADTDPGFERLSKFAKLVGDIYLIPVQSKFDPNAEVCDNNKDDTGNGLIDCADPDCKQTQLCRVEVPKQLEVFVMSECPYGTRALNAMEEVLDALPDISFKIHFIADYNAGTGKFNSLHGQTEVDENIRQLCVINHYPEVSDHMNYIWCRNKNLKGDWKACVTEAGLDVAKIETCATGEEGKNLLIEDIKIGNSLGIGASPTWLANNKYQFSGVTADQVKVGICQNNKDLPGCDKALSNAPAPAAAGSAACG